MSEDIEYIREAYESLKRIHITANDTNDKLSVEINKLKEEILFLSSQLSNANNFVEIQRKIVTDSLTSGQEKLNLAYDEIVYLKNEIKLLKL